MRRRCVKQLDAVSVIERAQFQVILAWYVVPGVMAIGTAGFTLGAVMRSSTFSWAMISGALGRIRKLPGDIAPVIWRPVASDFSLPPT